MFSTYLKEREGLDTLEFDHGFISFRINKDECYIKHIYVEQEHRKSGYASQMADAVAEIARAKGCHWLTGSVSANAEGAHASLLVLLGYGMKLVKADSNMIYFGRAI
jgi:GNAT superfamily N-acetyltransferase